MMLPRLLYLGLAFPPGVSSLFPELQPAGHLIETNLVESIGSHFDIRSVGISGIDSSRIHCVPTASPGLPHSLNLIDRPPALWHRMRSLQRLWSAYDCWSREGWTPDVLLVCNGAPVYNAFIRGLVRRSIRPRLVLYLPDSVSLGISLPRLKRLRYRLKPFKWLDDDMAAMSDACVAVSTDTERWFRRRNKPWLWLPNGMEPDRVRKTVLGPNEGPVVFGYFGHAGEHTGLPQLLRLFTSKTRPAELRICAFGKPRHDLEAKHRNHPGVSFHGPFDPEGCVDFGAKCDVLVNPRPIVPGNTNNFSSKVFEYALTGRSILTSRLSGVDEVLGENAYYFDANDFDNSLEHCLTRLVQTPKAELNRRGAAIQNRLLARFSWEAQGERLAEFLNQVCDKP